MNASWEQMPISKIKIALIIAGVFLVILLIVIASSIVKIDGDEVGIVEQKLFGGNLPEGKVLAVGGENGVQAQILAPGCSRFMPPRRSRGGEFGSAMWRIGYLSRYGNTLESDVGRMIFSGTTCHVETIY